MSVKLIAAIGSGGKTTALNTLARQWTARHSGPLLLTTTTHILPLSPPACRVCLTDPTPEGLAAELEHPGILCTGSAAKEGKLGSLIPEALALGLNTAPMTLYEGDGSRRLPLKLHRPGEPVLLPGTSRCLVVAGLSALGKPVGQVVHRYERNPIWQASPNRIVGPEEVAFCVLEAVRSAQLPLDCIRVLLNQADTQTDPRPAAQILERLTAEGLVARAESLAQNPAFLYDFVME